MVAGLVVIRLELRQEKIALVEIPAGGGGEGGLISEGVVVLVGKETRRTNPMRPTATESNSQERLIIGNDSERLRGEAVQPGALNNRERLRGEAVQPGAPNNRERLRGEAVQPGLTHFLTPVRGAWECAEGRGWWW